MTTASDRATLALAHSPDSDDMVMWWPLTGMLDAQGRPVDGPLGSPCVPIERFDYRCEACDIEALNKRSLAGSHGAAVGGVGGVGQPDDITAISAGAYPALHRDYRITACGASMGDGYGPKVVVRADSDARTLDDAVADPRGVAIPGVNTTAFLALRLLVGREPSTVREMRFDHVVADVERGTSAAGLLIHEAQIMPDSGLRVVADLGAIWGQRHALPLPLGLNVVRRDLDARFGEGTCLAVSGDLERSIRYAIANPALSRRYLLLHADDRPEWRDDELLDRYMAMYVNEATADMGDRGRRALELLFTLASDAGLRDPVDRLDVLPSIG